jgi:hypothetical protein
MRYRRLLLVATFAIVLSTILVGTGSFSTVNAERDISASVVSDESAFLKVTQINGAERFVDGEAFTVLRLADQFSGDVALEAVTLDSSLISLNTSAPQALPEPPDSLDVRVQCEESGDTTVPITVIAEGSGNRAIVERDVSVTCIEPEIQKVEFNGCGNVQIKADDALYPLSVTKVIDNPSSNDNTTSTVNLKRDGKLAPGKGGKLVAIEANGDRYENPNDCNNDAGPPDDASKSPSDTRK